MMWCSECACITNHSGDQHREAVKDLEERDAVDDRWDVRHDQMKDGPEL